MTGVYVLSTVRADALASAYKYEVSAVVSQTERLRIVRAVR